MNKRLKFLPNLLLLLAFAVFASGCNIFGFTSDAQLTPKEKAEKEIRDGNYAKAKDYLSEAVKDSTDAEALYLDAKATLLSANIDLLQIADFVDKSGTTENGKPPAILNLIDDLTPEKQTIWYQANMKAIANLSRIIDGKTTGAFKPEDVALDYSIANLMYGVLGIRDTNRDDVIDDKDFKFDLKFVDNLANTSDKGFNLDGGKFEGQSFKGLEVFLGDFALKPGKVSKYKYTPDDINPFINFVLTTLDKGAEGLKIIISKQLTSIDPAEVDKYIAEIAKIINFYWYNDGIDNDGDSYTDDKGIVHGIDEEIINGIDDDHDGLTDEDTGYYPAADPTPGPHNQYIEIFKKWKNK